MNQKQKLQKKYNEVVDKLEQLNAEAFELEKQLREYE